LLFLYLVCWRVNFVTLGRSYALGFRRALDLCWNVNCISLTPNSFNDFTLLLQAREFRNLAFGSTAMRVLGLILPEKVGYSHPIRNDLIDLNNDTRLAVASRLNAMLEICNVQVFGQHLPCESSVRHVHI
jgi:hypothetical protein